MSGTVVVNMWSSMYSNKSVYGILDSTDGNTVTMTDGSVFETTIDDLGVYCSRVRYAWTPTVSSRHGVTRAR